MALAAAMLLAGCVATPTEQLAAPVGQGLDRFPSDGDDLATAALTPGRVNPWWVRALDAPLSASVIGSFQTSQSLAEAAANVDLAAANLRLATAGLGPTLDINTSAQVADGPIELTETFSGNYTATIPLDVFGALRAAREAAQFDLEEAIALFEEARRDLAEALALAHVDLAEAVRLRQLLGEQLELSRTLQSLNELRFTQGQATVVDVFQQRDQVNSLEQQIPTAEAQIRTASNAIAALTGRPPPDVAITDGVVIPDVRAEYDLPTPRQILDTRPDLAAARAALEAADRRFVEAVRDRLPDFTLSGQGIGNLVAGAPSSLLTGVLASSFTLFSTGAQEAAIDAARASLLANAAAYYQDWLDALQEIDSLIATERRDREALRLTGTRVETARTLLESAESRFRQGGSAFLPVLNAIQTLQAQEVQAVNDEADLARTRVMLHSALGTLPVPGVGP